MRVAPPKRYRGKRQAATYLLGEPPQDGQVQDCAWRGIGWPALHSRERPQERVGALQGVPACLRSHCLQACNLYTG